MEVTQPKRSGYVVRHKVEGAQGKPTIVTAFLPESQLMKEWTDASERSGTAPSTSTDADGQMTIPKKAKGDKVEVLFTVAEMTLGKSRIVVSERAARGRSSIDLLAEGQVCVGVVTGLADFGAFIALKNASGQFNGIEALLPLSEISWDIVKHPSDRLNLGQKLEVMVKTITSDDGSDPKTPKKGTPQVQEFVSKFGHPALW